MTTKRELLAQLERFPDDMPIVFMGDEGNYFDDLVVMEVRTLGLFTIDGDYTYYKRTRMYNEEKWIEDREVIILG